MPLERRLDLRYYSSAEGLRPFAMDDAAIIDAIDVFGGDLTCCRLGHPNAAGGVEITTPRRASSAVKLQAEPCDREALMLPMLGLFCELYRDRHRHRRSRAAYNTIEPHLERLYPR